MSPQASSQRRKPLGPSWADGGVLFRAQCLGGHIVLPHPAGSRVGTVRWPDGHTALPRWADCVCLGKEKPPLCKGGTAWQSHAGGDCEAKQMIQLSAVAQCGSTAWERRLAANPPGGASRHPPLHKGGVFAWVCSTGPYNKKPPEREAFLLCTWPGLHFGSFRRSRSTEDGNALSRGEYGSGGSPPIPPAAQAATPLCTRGASLPGFVQPAHITKSLPRGRLFCYALGQDCILVLSGGAGAPGPDSASSRGEYGRTDTGPA